MYNFHKRRELDYDNVFYHNLFIKGGIESLNLIKRKKKIDKIESKNNDALSLMYNQQLSGKQLTKKNYKAAITSIMNKLSDMKEKQNDLELSSTFITNQNKELLSHNEYLLKEIRSKM